MIRFLTILVLAASAVADEHECTGENCNQIDWTSEGDSDPHIAIRMLKSKLDRPVCYNLDGKDGDVFALYEAGSNASKMTVTSQLVKNPRPQHSASTYFGKFVFTTKFTEVEVRPNSIIVKDIKSGKSEVSPWRHNVWKSHSTFFADEAQNMTVVHWKRKVIKIALGETVFEVKKNLLRYGAHKDNFYYLGIYLMAAKNETYGGLIGESLNDVATYVKDKDHETIVIDGKSIAIVDKRRTDYLNNRIFDCWLVKIEDLLKHPLDFYRRRL